MAFENHFIQQYVTVWIYIYNLFGVSLGYAVKIYLPGYYSENVFMFINKLRSLTPI